mmetsp:Transcript_6353/g.12586  ORF Transcript_6353/g.12586 Transcript_6353/m.12586 type:complete len:184 (-) Transcript_6353:7-558(-)
MSEDQKPPKTQCAHEGCLTVSFKYLKGIPNKEEHKKEMAREFQVSFATLKRCSQCRQVAYCSVDCQKADWKRHKPDCLRFCDKTKPKLENIPSALDADIFRMLVEISMSVITVGERREVYLAEEYKGKVHAMGERLHNLGGSELMRDVHSRVHSHFLDLQDKVRAGDLCELTWAWNGIGTWVP